MQYNVFNNNRVATRGGSTPTGNYVGYDINGGAMKLQGTTSSVLNSEELGIRVAHVSAGDNIGTIVRSNKDLGAAQYGGTVVTGLTVTSGTTSNRPFLINQTGLHGLSVGSQIRFSDTNSVLTGPAAVTVVNNTTGFTVNRPYVAGVGTVTYSGAIGTFANLVKRNYTMIGVNGLVHGQAQTVTRGSADMQNRVAIAKVNQFRTNKVATAIRAGYWNVFSGTFTTAPTNVNDYTSLDIDGTDVPDNETKVVTNRYNIGGGFSYKQVGRPGANGVTRADNDLKNT